MRSRTIHLIDVHQVDKDGDGPPRGADVKVGKYSDVHGKQSATMNMTASDYEDFSRAFKDGTLANCYLRWTAGPSYYYMGAKGLHLSLYSDIGVVHSMEVPFEDTEMHKRNVLDVLEYLNRSESAFKAVEFWSTSIGVDGYCSIMLPVAVTMTMREPKED